jgi:HTH-type transcriptional regulator/antitoxin HigA
MGALSVDVPAYGRLLARTTPKVIENEAEYDHMLAQAERLMDRGDRRTREEDALLSLLVSLIQTYEEKRYPMRRPSPHKMLRYLIEQRGLKQADLVPLFKSSGYASDVISGKRSISRVHARKLADFFGVSTDLFI